MQFLLFLWIDLLVASLWRTMVNPDTSLPTGLLVLPVYWVVSSLLLVVLLTTSLVRTKKKLKSPWDLRRSQEYIRLLLNPFEGQNPLKI
jgi:hypothetical protein